MNRLKRYSIALIFLLLVFMVGCNQDQDKKQVSLIVSKDFGQEIIFSSEIEFEGKMTVMDILVDNLDVETAYSGGFVNSIEGIKSTFKEDPKNPRDWFYYIDDKEAQVGANSYFLEGGEEIKWDYHQWKVNQQN